MSDTARSLSALQTLLADNTSGAISPQDLRDFLITAVGGYGEIYVSGGATAQSIGTAQTALTAFTADGSSDGQVTPDYANDRITIVTAGVYLLEVSPLSFSGSSSATITFQLAVDGVATGRACERKLSSTGDIGDAHVSAIATCVGAEQITVLVNADAASKSVTVKHANLRVRRIG